MVKVGRPETLRHRHPSLAFTLFRQVKQNREPVVEEVGREEAGEERAMGPVCV
ncbi:MAG: hypothetical protein RMJ98_23330 [Myxococcales bacterium]|nr:hypothetical protein [Myxococcales bacterium]